MKRTVFFAIMILLAAMSYAQPPEKNTPTNQITPIVNEPATWLWTVGPDTRLQRDLLVAYKIKEQWGARNSFGSIKLKSTALYADASDELMLNELIAALGRAGLLEKVKGLEDPRRASISILNFTEVKPTFIYTTEQQ